MANDHKRNVFVAMLLMQYQVSLLLLQLAFDHASAQQNNITQEIYKICNPNAFSSSSSFSRNLDNVIALVSQHTSSSSYYYAFSISNASSPSDNAYAVYQCRGDLSFSNCSLCVSSIIHADPLPCGSVSGLRIQLLGCYFRYETFDFRGLGTALVRNICSSSTNANSSFQRNLASVLNATALTAPYHGGFNASSEVSTGGDSAYALAQCLGYLTPTQCVTCLAAVSNYSTVCPDATAGQEYYDTCSYVYSSTPVLLSGAGSDTAIPSSFTPSPGGIPAAEGTKRGSKFPVLVVGIVLGVIVLGAVGALFLFWKRKQKRTANALITSLEQKFQHVATRFSLDELRQATGSFNSENKLGEGGFGPVYKGRLRNDREVAIKMLSAKSHQGKEQFLNEVNLITNVQHRNLIELLGCCVEDSERLLVYEYLPKRSLNLHLFGDVSQRAVLSWRTRKEIMIGIARGLVYLHEDSKVKIVHRDIKASNILLDDDFNPKIADFGLARLFPDYATHVTTRVAGTMGYVAPDYATNGKLTEKADVYSFGLVTLEIVSGRRINDERLPQEEEQLLPWAWALYERQQQLQILDPKLRNTGENAADVIRVVHVALLCTQTLPGSRPAMSEVFAMLCGQSDILALPTKPTHI